MSRSSPCRGERPHFSKNRCISSNPAMMRSSRGERPPFFSGGANSSSSERSSSRSRSVIAPLVLEADKGSRALGHPLFPRVRRADRRKPPPLLLEFDRPYSEFFGFFRTETRALGGNSRLH